MPYILIAFFIFVSGCATKDRRPSSAEFSGQVIDLESALHQGAPSTVANLKAKTTAKSYEGLNPRDPFMSLPHTLKAERTPQVLPKEKSQQTMFLRRFHGWSLNRKTARAQQLLTDFQCGNALEAQSLGFSLELDFPEAVAATTSQALHEKVLVCQAFSRQESLFKLAIFAIQKGQCGRANEYLDMFPATPERGINDRLSYLRGFCSGPTIVSERNPWGGYGVLLSPEKSSEDLKPSWTLGVNSGVEEWDRLLATFIELHEQGKSDTIRYLASKLNYEKFRSLPLPFQTSMLVLMSFSGADLPVFQTLHRYLSEHPEMASPEVAGLLFPVRYWTEIVENSKRTDPVLVKALIRQESAFNPMARSRARAAGLMQLIYPTAKNFGIKRPTELLSPEANIHAGSEFLAQLINEFGSVELALAAYNAGPGIVRRWQKRYPTENIDLFVEMIPYSETREYVRLVRRNYKIYQSILVKPQTLTENMSLDKN